MSVSALELEVLVHVPRGDQIELRPCVVFRTARRRIEWPHGREAVRAVPRIVGIGEPVGIVAQLQRDVLERSDPPLTFTFSMFCHAKLSMIP